MQAELIQLVGWFVSVQKRVAVHKKNPYIRLGQRKAGHLA